MVKTRQDNKFTCWSFTLNKGESVSSLEAMSVLCEKLSYDNVWKDGTTTFFVNCRFFEAQRYDDLVDTMPFAHDIYPQSRYTRVLDYAALFRLDRINAICDDQVRRRDAEISLRAETLALLFVVWSTLFFLWAVHVTS